MGCIEESGLLSLYAPCIIKPRQYRLAQFLLELDRFHIAV